MILEAAQVQISFNHIYTHTHIYICVCMQVALKVMPPIYFHRNYSTGSTITSLERVNSQQQKSIFSCGHHYYLCKL